jgi:undecaprenyl-diphosphatase
MAFASDYIARLTRKPQSIRLNLGASSQTASWIKKLGDADLAAVHLLAGTARSTFGRLLAISISKLGNGWIYLILAPIVLLGLGRQGGQVLLLATINAALLHCLYPILKRIFCRKRPFHIDPRLPSLLKTLDEHSFPSGHAMTLTGVLAPIVIAWPAMTVSAAILVISMAWSRVATAHHYPSDVAAGAALGVGLAYPLSIWAGALL